MRHPALLTPPTFLTLTSLTWTLGFPRIPLHKQISTSGQIVPTCMNSPQAALLPFLIPASKSRFCLSCMSAIKITLKDMVHSLHVFLRGSHQRAGIQAQSIPTDPLRPSFSVPRPGASGGRGHRHPTQPDLSRMPQPPGVRVWPRRMDGGWGFFGG